MCIPAATQEAAKHLDGVIKGLKSNFSEKSDYLRILVKTFAEVVKGPENKHLQLFYMILPSLTISHIDANLVAKDKLGKKNSPDTYIWVTPYPLLPSILPSSQ